jgi:signal transduction histidine kinase
MKKSAILFIFLILSMSFPLKGQEKFLRITNMPEVPCMPMDTILIGAIIKRAVNLTKTRPDSSLYYMRLALVKARELNNLEQTARALYGMCYYYTTQNDFTMALRYVQQSINMYAQLGQEPIKQYSALGALYRLKGMHTEAISIYRKVKDMPLRNATDSLCMNKLYCSIAHVFWEQGMSDSSMKIYYHVIANTRASDSMNYSLLYMAYNGIANTYMRLEQWDKVWSFFDKAFAMSLKLNDSTVVVNSMSNKGTILYQQKNYKAAKAIHLETLEWARRKKSSSQIYASALMVGAILAKEGKYDEALLYASEAYNSHSATESINSRLKSSYLMGCVYTHSEKYEMAKKYLLPAVKYAEDYHYYSDLADGYDHLSTVYAGMGQYKKALEYREKFMRVQDSMNGEKNANQVAAVEMKYKTAEKDKQIAQKSLLLSRQKGEIREKNIWIGSLAAGAVLLTIVVLSLYNRKRHRETLHKAHILNMEKDRQIQVLKAKMEGEEVERSRLARDLHDGVVVKFSAVKMNLSVLPEQHNSLEGAGDFQKIISRLDEATMELRATAHNLLPDTLLEGGLSEAVHYFCKDMQQSSGIEIDLQQYTEMPRFTSEFELSVYRILQEILQNVLKHAEAAQVIVQMTYDRDQLSITVEDNGKGFVPEIALSNSGIGMKNIRSRVAALKGHLDIRSAPGKGTSFYMEFKTPHANN